jgi:chromosome partitioning protein
MMGYHHAMNRAMRRAVKAAFVNFKGGVGKTTTCQQAAHRVARRGGKVLVVEVDPQGNMTLAMTNFIHDPAQPDLRPPCSLADVLDRRSRATISDAIVHTHREGFDLVPGGFKELQAVSDQLISQMGAESSLKTALEPVMDEYDYIFFDCRPSTDLITRNAMVAADCAVIVTEPLAWGNNGVRDALDTVDDMRHFLGVDLPVAGFVVNKYDSRRLDQAGHLNWLEEVSADQTIPILGLPIPLFTEISRLAENGLGLDEHPKETAKMRVIGETYDAVVDAISATGANTGVHA